MLLSDLDGDIKYITDFKYLEPINSNDSDPSSFDEYFSNCVTENIPKDEVLSLLFSGGKDSTSLFQCLASYVLKSTHKFCRLTQNEL